MFGFNEAAALYARIGQRGGRPAFAREGVRFMCRSEPAWIHRMGGSAIENVADTRIFAEAMDAARERFDPRPGDRIALDGRYYRIAEVQPMRGWCGIHHLEILARDEGPADRMNNNA